MKIKKGQRIAVSYEDREFDVIVIDPNGFGEGQPSVGFGFRMMEKYGGLPNNTLSNWLTKESGVQGAPNNEIEYLKLPSGNTYRVLQITGDDGNNYTVVEVSDWVILAADVLKKPGKIKKSTKDKLIDFLAWFAVKGFYAESYAALKGAYTPKDSRVLTAWLQARLGGKEKRKKYTDFLQKQGCSEWYDYANWTDYVYMGLFGKTSTQMKKAWELVEGNKDIARNYISKPEALKAIAYCENQVVELFIDDLEQAHNDAIDFTNRKFFNR